MVTCIGTRSKKGKRIKIDGINARKLAIAAITVVYPIPCIEFKSIHTHSPFASRILGSITPYRISTRSIVKINIKL